MALYFYQAFSKEGKKVSGYLDASSAANVKDKLVQQGMYPITITPAQEHKASWWRGLFVRSLSVKDKILFTSQLAVLLKAGIPLLQALELLVEQFTGTMHSMLVAIKDEVKQGTSLADALKQYPKSFDQIYVQLVRAGEASGKLELILERLTSYLERREELRKRVSGALTYPIMQLVFSVVVVAALLYWVVPGMTSSIKEMSDKPLPLPTRMLMSISTVFTSYLWVLIALVVVVLGSFLYWRSTKQGAYLLDVIKLRIPILNYFVRMNAIVQFCYTFGLLLESGVNLAESLDIVVKIIDNRVLSQMLSEARDKIIKQGKISQYLKQTDIFPPIAIYLINTGEQSGQLDKMLLTVAKNYEEDLAEWADSLTGLIGPVLLIFMSVIVGFIILSIILPMTQMMETITV